MTNRQEISNPSDEPCVFCRIVKGEIPSMKVYEDEYAIAFLDINPVNPGHTLIVPKNHYEQLNDMPIEMAEHMMKVAWKIVLAIKKEIDPLGFNIISNNGKEAGQLIPHFHMHVIPRFHEDKTRFAFIWGTKKIEEEQMKKIQEGIKEKLKETV